ncbi:hypothetical protein J6590_056205 [Homalodisca vitripennis]|nr:hypothetical protein J6590_056205 [Homalodisca vitripennis]
MDCVLYGTEADCGWTLDRGRGSAGGVATRRRRRSWRRHYFCPVLPTVAGAAGTEEALKTECNGEERERGRLKVTSKGRRLDVLRLEVRIN